MKLLLHADIPKLGYFGDVVEVKVGYARNYLLPQGLAVEPTESNVKAIEDERANKAKDRKLAHERLLKTSGKVDGAKVTIRELANETGHLFGSVSENDVAEALCKDGFEVQAKHVQLPSHIQMLGEHEVKLRFAEDISVGVVVNVIRPEDEAGESESEQQDTDPDADAKQG